MPRILTILFSVALLVPKLQAEPEMAPVFSLSRQFAIYGPKGTPSPGSNRMLMALDPNFLAVSCERIKQTILGELNGHERSLTGAANSGEGKIHVILHRGSGQMPLITPIQNGGFSYRLDLPNMIEASRLVDAISEVILLEMVNRNSPGSFTRLPRWLSTGISEMVRADSPETLALQANLPIARSRVQKDPLVRIRKNLASYVPLTFEELSWPENLTPDRASHYEECAHLFVTELLHLKNGENSMRHMLQGLSSRLNWQMAFLDAYNAHFKQLVDVEKWWSLRVVGLAGRDAAQLWSPDQSMEAIDAALAIPVQQFSAAAGPNRGNVALQEIVSAWEPAQQRNTLPKVSNQLRGLRRRVHPDFVPLIDEYCATLDHYLEREKRGTIRRILNRQGLSSLRDATTERLNLLDQQRTELRNRPKPSTREQAIQSALEAGTAAGFKPNNKK